MNHNINLHVFFNRERRGGGGIEKMHTLKVRCRSVSSRKRIRHKGPSLDLSKNPLSLETVVFDLSPLKNRGISREKRDIVSSGRSQYFPPSNLHRSCGKLYPPESVHHNLQTLQNHPKCGSAVRPIFSFIVFLVITCAHTWEWETTAKTKTNL